MWEQPPAALRTALRRRYTIDRELGRGGMAHVFLARDLRHDRAVAIKVLRPEIAVTLGTERFLREIQLAAKLQHPGILPLYDSGESGGWLYYVTPWIDGPSLRQRLDREGPLPLEDALRIAAEICDALSYAHGQDIVHRDIKPDNILLTRGHSLVSDFGLARAITAAGGERLSETGIAVGTPEYMSPEQAGAEFQVDGRSDVYSLGCVVYEMLAGTRPFTGSSAQAVLARHALDPVPPLSTVRKAVPEHIERAVIKALEKVPADRFATAAQFAEALMAPRAAAARRPRRLKRLPALIAGGVVLLGGGAWLAANVWRTDAPRIRRIAVLPLTNLTGDSAQEFLADGIHESVIAELARIEAVTVISRTSMLRYRGTERSVPEIARELGVDAIVEGSFFRAGDSVRVVTQLIDGRTDEHLWAETYVRDLRDVLRLHGEVATAIAGEIRVAVTPAERGRLASARPVDREAYLMALKGQYECQGWTEDGLRRGIASLRGAIDRDASYAPAYARLAICYSDRAFFLYAHPGESNQLAMAAVRRALELDSTLGEAHANLGWIRFVTDLDFDAPDQNYRRALELSPGSAPILHSYADYLTLAGRFDDAVVLRQRALELDPLSVTASVSLGWTYFKARRYDAAIAQLNRTLELEPGHWFAHMELGWSYLQAGKPSVAIAHCDSAVARAPPADDQVLFGTCGWVYGRAGQRQRAQGMLGRLTSMSSRRWVDPVHLSLVYVGLGDHDRALDLLSQAARERLPSLVFLKVEPQFDPLRSDPRFKALLRELGIES